MRIRHFNRQLTLCTAVACLGIAPFLATHALAVEQQGPPCTPKWTVTCVTIDGQGRKKKCQCTASDGCGHTFQHTYAGACTGNPPGPASMTIDAVLEDILDSAIATDPSLSLDINTDMLLVK